MRATSMVWHPRSLRPRRAFSVAMLVAIVISAIGMTSAAQIARAASPEPSPLPSPGVDPLTIDASVPGTASVPRMGRFDQQFRLNRSFGVAVNDPDVIDVTATFTAPSGASFIVPAYWGLDYVVQSGTGIGSSEGYDQVALDPPADGIWHIRFSPDEVGTWTYALQAEDHRPGQESAASSPTMTFEVTPSAAKGQVILDTRDDRFLRYQDGSPYLPMGHNVAFQQGEPVGNDGEHYVEPLFASMEVAGQDWTRIWMTDFNRNALEWSAGHWAGWYSGVGQYAGQSAFRIERQLEVADEHGLQVQLVINDHGQVRSMVDGRWDQNPYNAANGGPVPASNPEDFFTNAEARDLFKQRLRYLVARYGAFRNLLAWELFNEVQFVGSDAANPYNSAQVRDDIVAWHAEMAGYLRSIDPYDHLITTSSDIESSLKDIWADPNIDLVQVHDYDPGLTTRDVRFGGYVETLNAAYGKPVIIAEFGINGNPEIEFDPVAAAPLDDREAHLLQATHLHNAAWASAMSGSGAMSWWWGAYIHSSPSRNRVAPDFPANERVNPPLRDFFADEDLAGMGLAAADIAAPVTVVALGLDNGTQGFAWIRDAQNEYGSGVGPGDVAGRTISGVSIGINGFADGSYRIEVHDPWGVAPMDDSLVATATGGTLTVPLPDFTRDIAIKIRPAETAPNAPTGATATRGDRQALVAWTAPTDDGGSSITSYTVTSSPGGLTATVGGAASSAIVSGLTNGTAYTFTVTATNGIGTGPASAPSNAVTPGPLLNQTITFAKPANKTLLQSPFTVTATASSGLPVTLTSTTLAVCTAAGFDITLLTAGTCSITATQPGNITYRAANPVTRTFTVSQASQTITFARPANKTLLQSPFTVTATASSGLPVTLTSTSPTICTVTGFDITLLTTGTCAITASQAGNATYKPATSVSRTFAVTRAPQTITIPDPGPQSMLVPTVVLTPFASSGLPVTLSTQTAAVCTVSGDTVTLKKAGTCRIRGVQAGNATYAAAPAVTLTMNVTASTPMAFVSASGDELRIGGQPFSFLGGSTYGTSNPGAPVDPRTTVALAVTGGLNSLRLVNMFDERGLDVNAPFAETDWRRVDGLIARARGAGLRVVLDLSAFRNHLVNRDIRANGWETACQAGADRSPVDYSAIDPYRAGLAGEWETFLDFAVGRVNTVNGVLYGADATIAVISIAGEPQPPASEECGKATSTAGLTDFYASTLGYLASIDANHLRSNGGLIHTDWEELYGGSSGIDGEAIFALADNTLPSLHTYPGQYEPDGTPIDYQTPDLGPVATGLGKPWFTEEFGWTQSVGDATRAGYYQWLYDEQAVYGSSGALFWNLGPESTGGSHDVNPGTPLTWAEIQAR